MRPFNETTATLVRPMSIFYSMPHHPRKIAGVIIFRYLRFARKHCNSYPYSYQYRKIYNYCQKNMLWCCGGVVVCWWCGTAMF